MLTSEKIGQFEPDPHLETTTMARLDSKHIDESIRIVKETGSKNSQTIRRWYVSRGSRVGPDTGKGFRKSSRGKLSTWSINTIVVLEILHQMFDCIYTEKKDYTYWSETVCLSRPGFCRSHILVNMHVWVLGSQSERNSILHQ